VSFLVVGLDCDPTTVHFLDHCGRAGAPVDAVNLREIAVYGQWSLEVSRRGAGQFRLGSRTWNLEDYSSVYVRLIDLTWYQRTAYLRARWYGLVAAVAAWLQAFPGLVVNRPFAGAHNSAKPLHEHLVAGAGLAVPASLSSCDPRRLRRFVEEHPAVNKSVSGVRGDTRRLSVEDLSRYNPAQGPVHLQRYVAGADVRVHVVGEAAIATRIDSTAVDYRAGGTPRYSPWRIPAEVERALVSATASFGLVFAGWDLKVDAGGVYWCLEANPQPGYNAYDRHMEGLISQALLELLSRSPGRTALGTGRG
jgi:hypothetical protein